MSLKAFKYDNFITKYFTNNKSNFNIFFCLTNFYGLNNYSVKNIIANTGISVTNTILSIGNEELYKVYRFIKYNLKFTLKQIKFLNVYNIKTIKNYKSYKHLYFMPVRGQRTRTNSNTRKKYKII